MKYVLLIAMTLSLACTTRFDIEDHSIEETVDPVIDVIEEMDPEIPTEDPVEDPEVDSGCEPLYEGGLCNVLIQCGCPDGYKCDFQCREGSHGRSMYETCITEGTAGSMEYCTDSWECQAGYTCGAHQCLKYCMTGEDCPAGQFCREYLTVSDCGPYWESDAIICYP